MTCVEECVEEVEEATPVVVVLLTDLSEKERKQAVLETAVKKLTAEERDCLAEFFKYGRS